MISQKRIDKGLYWERAWSLVSGCTPVSPGCDNCWAMAMEDRFNGGDHTVRFHKDRLCAPRGDQKPKVWSIWNDFFHPGVHWNSQFNAFRMMAYSPYQIFLILTKRPEIMAGRLDDIWLHLKRIFPVTSIPLLNIYFGVTAENQEQANKRIPILLSIPDIKRFVSLEPLLGPISLDKWCYVRKRRKGKHWYWESPPWESNIGCIIVGGESGPKARPCKPGWIKDIILQCRAARVPVFVKQLGNNDGTKRYQSKRADEETIREVLGECPRELPWM